MGSLIDARHFVPLLRLQAQWEVIRGECALLDRTDILDLDRVDKTHETVAEAVVASGQPRWVQAWGIDKDRWLNWGFVVHDQLPLGDAGAPKTAQLLGHLRGLKVAALSLFKPGLRLPLHTHPELGAEHLFTFHLGLQVPPDGCCLYADGDFALERDGEALVFDGSRPHYAFNVSEHDRLILYCEFSPERLCWVD